MRRGQALVELAVSVPILLLMAVGGAACVQVADAEDGLRAATQAAAASAARAPDPLGAATAARRRFEAVVAAYPLRSPVLSIDLGGFQRAGTITISASASVDVGWAGLIRVPSALALTARANARVEAWRTHR